MGDLRQMATDSAREKFNTKFVRQWLNRERTAFQVLEVYPDGREIPVSENQDVYLRWLRAGNVPAEWEFVPPKPPPPDERTPEEKEADEYFADKDLARVLHKLLKRVDALEKGRGK